MVVRSAAVSVSLAAHVGLIAAASHAPPRPLRLTTPATSQLVELTSVTQESPAPNRVPSAVPAATSTLQNAAAPLVHEVRAKVSHVHVRAPAMTSSSTVQAPTAPMTPSADAASTVGVAQFTLPPSSQWSASILTPAPAIVNAAKAARVSEVVAEHDVSARAKLLSAADVAYPLEARAAEIEADVPVEIVVDTQGAVADARALARSGYGLDAAALRAIRSYRFEPAVRDGRRVAVRMRWQVSFRLR